MILDALVVILVANEEDVAPTIGPLKDPVKLPLKLPSNEPDKDPLRLPADAEIAKPNPSFNVPLCYCTTLA